jgi:repressor LexA
MEYTVKYLEKNEGGYYLRAGNPKYADIHPTQDLQVYGVVTGSFRKYR